MLCVGGGCCPFRGAQTTVRGVRPPRLVTASSAGALATCCFQHTGKAAEGPSPWAPAPTREALRTPGSWPRPALAADGIWGPEPAGRESYSLSLFFK